MGLIKHDSRASRLLTPGLSPLATAVPDLSPTQPHVRGKGRETEYDGSTQAWSGMIPRAWVLCSPQMGYMSLSAAFPGPVVAVSRTEGPPELDAQGKGTAMR